MLNLKQLLDSTLEQADHLLGLGKTTDNVFDAYYYLWTFSIPRFGKHKSPRTKGDIMQCLSLSDLETFKKKCYDFGINQQSYNQEKNYVWVV